MSFELCLKCQHNKGFFEYGHCQAIMDDKVCGHVCTEWIMFSPEDARTAKTDKHPLAIEVMVNCAECGSLLGVEAIKEHIAPQQLLLCVEKCQCAGVEASIGEAELAEIEARLDKRKDVGFAVQSDMRRLIKAIRRKNG